MHLFELCGNWILFSEAFELLFELDSTWQLKVIPDKYLRKNMRGANMTLQKCQKKILPKGLNSNLNFIWSFQKMFF